MARRTASAPFSASPTISVSGVLSSSMREQRSGSRDPGLVHLDANTRAVN
ncbi:hypothetical protein DFR72_10818 [Lentzea flaviverrucosa]|uniref:Uncharacterized protein n=1 Tax=Lentzea flaviverrucosa TaxID=200379 RepID=A0A1H9SF21_9PSEU|nr:hypothetical protein DFR72_10818 [Lentzea flaviverrucosa]SER82963.1 hypothetical protein SAMN05216195_10719 [Lentzea flaviverrucosa]